MEIMTDNLIGYKWIYFKSGDILFRCQDNAADKDGNYRFCFKYHPEVNNWYFMLTTPGFQEPWKHITEDQANDMMFAGRL